MAHGPAVPTFIFRGHASPVHALHFFSSNTYLASGDSNGWIVIWVLATKRPLAAWKGHEGGVMGLKDWAGDRLLSHGRDHVLRVWDIRENDFREIDIKLPVDDADPRTCKQPWLLHSMTANALNYCAFSVCNATSVHSTSNNDPKYKPLWVATANGLDAGGVDIFHLPSQRRVCKLPSDKNIPTGMVMALSLFEQVDTSKLILVSGYESGHVIVSRRKEFNDEQWEWERLWFCQPHSQPVLSIDVSVDTQVFVTSSADSIINKFMVPLNKLQAVKPMKSTMTKHAGQQDITVRDDGKIFSTAGWDKRIRVYSTKTLKELAVLKWHQEGCYSVAFAKTMPTWHQPEEDESTPANDTAMTPLDVIKRERHADAQKKHWLAGGSKDGKISLWDVY